MWIIGLVNCKIEGNINVMCLAEGEGVCVGLIGAGLLVDVKNCEYVGKISITSLMDFSVSSLFAAAISKADSCESYADITVNGVVIPPEEHAYDSEHNRYNNCIFDSYENRPNK